MQHTALKEIGRKGQVVYNRLEHSRLVNKSGYLIMYGIGIR